MKAEVAEGVEEKKRQHQQTDTAEQIKRELISWFWVILAFLIIEGVFVQARVIPSGSMENTVLIGDHLIVSRIAYDAEIPFTSYHVPLWRNPKRQQIIVFRAPLPEQGYPDFIKRCIGVPGDHIKIVMGAVYVNGVRLVEPYALHDPYANDSSAENYPPTDQDYTLDGRARPQWSIDMPQHIVNGELVVPPHEYFMMGDNRDNSNDSRFWGFVPRENIIGTPVVIYMSINAPEEVWDPGHIGDRFLTYLKIFVDPGEVRWRRLFHVF